MDHPIDRAFAFWGKLCAKRPWAVLSLGLLLTLGFGWSASGLRSDLSFIGILDEDDPAMARLAEVTAKFGAASSVFVVITGGLEDERRAAAEEVETALQGHPLVSDARAQLDPTLLSRYALMGLDDEGFAAVERGLTKAEPTLARAAEVGGVVGLVTAMHEALVLRGGPRPPPEEVAAALKGMAGLTRWIADPTEATGREAASGLLGGRGPAPGAGVGSLPLRDGFFAAPDGSVYAVDVRTRLDPLTSEVGSDKFGELEAAIDPIRAAHPKLSVRTAGLMPGSHQDQQNVLSKVQPLSTLTLVLVLLCLLMFDRKPITPILVGMALLVSLVWTLGLVRVVFGVASVMVSAFGMMLFGLGIDYAAHLIARYNDERAQAHSPEQALVTTLGRAGRGVAVGALTTSIAFALMALTDFKAAVQLGITAALGLISAAVIMLLFLPAGLMLGEGKIPRKVVSARLGWIDALVRGSISRPRLTVGLWGAVVLSAALLTPRFRLETNLESLITQDLPALAAAKDLSRAFGGSAEAIYSVSPTVEESRARGEAFLALPGVARVDGVFQLIPPDAQARVERNKALLPLLERLKAPEPSPGGPDLERLYVELDSLGLAASRIALESRLIGAAPVEAAARELKAAVEDAKKSLPKQAPGALAEGERALFGAMNELLDGARFCASLTQFTPAELPQALQDRYSRGGELLTLVFPKDYRIQFDTLAEFKRQVHSVDPEATGALFVMDQLLVGGLDRLPMAVAAILLALVIVLLLDLRSVRKVALAMTPLIGGCALAVAVILAFNIPASVLMLAGFPLLFGIGVDDGVHILHRWDEGAPDIAESVSSTGRAIFFTSFTTAIGFSILFLINHNGLSSLALLVNLGVMACFLSSVTLLPALASLTEAKRPAVSGT
jgi:predicted RND superfamily exporter protein